MDQHDQLNISRIEALSIIGLIFIIIFISLFKFEASPHIPIFTAIVVLMGFALVKKQSWSFIENALKRGLKEGLIPIFLFILIGILIGVWMLSGTIPTFIFYGSQIISAKFFLPSAFIVTAVIGTCIGSAFTTASTIGVAFIALGTAMGFNPAIVAGAIISGAFLGDKMSPVSDTTNIASAIGKVDLFEHIRDMLWTTIPAFVLCLILFTVMGKPGENSSLEELSLLPQTLENAGLTHPFALLPAVIMFGLAVKRVPAIFVMMVGIIAGIVVAFSLQPSISINQLMDVMQNGYASQTGEESIDSILSRGGIQSMMWSVSLVLLTLIMGGLIQKLGIIASLMSMLQSFITSTGKLILSTVATAIGVNITIGEQYMSIILTGHAYEKEFVKNDISSKNLARILEDAGTVINPLIPYGVSGVFMTSVLGVEVLDYLPYAFFCLLCPLLSIFYGFTGISIYKREKPEVS
ncbi:Na+/H+ antiporter NhaC [Sutcliffiella halmapala]|uniref:Na+/H+ antiporter NhaC n=1 Tax=Sutcliffiella halmapala TaxID=79882 RepID=UPI00099512B1|nr:Na+/H+ antiporter NhaC [Sutcliffiella halmapala]